VTGCVSIRLVAAIVLSAGALKTWDAVAGEPSAIQYSTGVLVAIGASETAVALWALWRPRHRLPALALAAFLLAVTLYLLSVPPGELERYGCQCFGERFRFQDIRDHLRFNGVLIVLAVAGAWLAKPAGGSDALSVADSP
jgi:hypothetical protein